MKKILISILSVVFITSLAFIGTGCKEEPAVAVEEQVEEQVEEEAEEVVELSFWTQWADLSLQVGEEMFSRWEAENPNIKVTHRVLPNDTAEELLRNAFASGAPPDVYYQENVFDLFKQADLGLIGDLTDFYTEYGDRFPEASHPYSYHNNSFWSVPVYGSSAGHIYYNKDIFEEYNIDVPEDWESFLEACETLKDNGVIPIAMGTKAGWPGLHWYVAFLGQTVGAEGFWANVQRTNKDETPKWTDPGFIKAAELYKSLFDKGYFDAGAGMLEYDSGVTQFFSGKAGMFFTGSWFEGLGVPDELNWSLFPFPKIAGEPRGEFLDRILTYLNGYSYSAACEHPKEAVKFIEFLTRPENAKVWYTIAKNIPATLDAVEDSELSEAGVAYVELAENATGALPFIETWVNPEAGEGEMYAGATGIATGQLTPEEWMQRIEDALVFE